MRIWDDVITESDKRRLAKASHGETTGFGTKPALLVVDVSENFVVASSPFAAGDMAWEVVRAIKRLVDQARAVQIPIFYTLGTAPTTPAQRGRRKGLSPSAADNKIVNEIKPVDGELVIVKPKPSAFFGTPLPGYLTYYGIDTIIVTGLVTSGCIRATVLDGYSYNLRVIVPEECVGDRCAVSHKVNLFDMHMKYADVVPLAQVLNNLESLARNERAIVRS